MISFKQYFRIGIFALILALAGSLSVTCSRLEKSQNNERRLEENARQQRYADSLRFSTETLRISEFKEYLKLRDAQLLKRLDKEKISPNKVERIISNNIHYEVRDTSLINLDSITKSILSNIPMQQNFEVIDSCSTLKGFINYNNGYLDLNITEKSFKNKTDIVLYKQRRQWRFLGIKTRIFGKREITARVFDQCGQSDTKEIIVK